MAQLEKSTKTIDLMVNEKRVLVWFFGKNDEKILIKCIKLIIRILNMIKNNRKFKFDIANCIILNYTKFKVIV